MEDKNFTIYKLPSELKNKLESIVEKNKDETNLSQLIIQTLERIHLEEIDYFEEKKLIDMQYETQNMIYSLLKEIQSMNEMNREIVGILLGDVIEEERGNRNE